MKQNKQERENGRVVLAATRVAPAARTHLARHQCTETLAKTSHTERRHVDTTFPDSIQRNESGASEYDTTHRVACLTVRRGQSAFANHSWPARALAANVSTTAFSLLHCVTAVRSGEGRQGCWGRLQVGYKRVCLVECFFVSVTHRPQAMQSLTIRGSDYESIPSREKGKLLFLSADFDIRKKMVSTTTHACDGIQEPFTKHITGK